MAGKWQGCRRFEKRIWIGYWSLKQGKLFDRVLYLLIFMTDAKSVYYLENYSCVSDFIVKYVSGRSS